MGLKKKEMMKMLVPVLFLMMAFTVEARFDANTLVGQMFKENGGEAKYLMKSTTTACCDKCSCTKSKTPQCHCRDIGETCHSACKFCLCAFSYPPQCRCTDTTNFCYPPCSSPDKPHMTATI